MITIDEFRKSTCAWPASWRPKKCPRPKAVQLTLSLGGEERRNVFAGIKRPTSPRIVGRLVICVANLQPRQMTFGMSEGMVVAAGAGGEEIYLLESRTPAPSRASACIRTNWCRGSSPTCQ